MLHKILTISLITSGKKAFWFWEAFNVGFRTDVDGGDVESLTFNTLDPQPM